MEADDRGVQLSGIVYVLAAAGIPERVQEIWLTSPTSLLSGEVPVEVLMGDPDRVLRAATRFASLQDPVSLGPADETARPVRG